MQISLAFSTPSLFKASSIEVKSSSLLVEPAACKYRILSIHSASPKINVNNTIGSAQGTQTHCALKTGTWDSGTTLVIEIGPSGKLYGSGGKGGDGGSSSGGQGDNGETGSSALGIQYACTVNNLGVIQSGYGGGGGGGGRQQQTNTHVLRK